MAEGDHDLLLRLSAEFAEYRIRIEDRLLKLNELRAEVTSDRRQYITQDIYYARHNEIVKRADELTTRVKEVEDWKANVSGRQAAFALMIGIAAVVVGLVIGYFTKK